MHGLFREQATDSWWVFVVISPTFVRRLISPVLGKAGEVDDAGQAPLPTNPQLRILHNHLIVPWYSSSSKKSLNFCLLFYRALERLREGDYLFPSRLDSVTIVAICSPSEHNWQHDIEVIFFFSPKCWYWAHQKSRNESQRRGIIWKWASLSYHHSVLNARMTAHGPARKSSTARHSESRKGRRPWAHFLTRRATLLKPKDRGFFFLIKKGSGIILCELGTYFVWHVVVVTLVLTELTDDMARIQSIKASKLTVEDSFVLLIHFITDQTHQRALTTHPTTEVFKPSPSGLLKTSTLMWHSQWTMV